MTAKTTNFSGLLYYNPATNGFNPVVSATIYCPDNMNEYDSITINVVTWNLPDGDLFWRVVPFGTNLTLDRFTLGSSDSTSLVNNRASFTIAVSADNATSADGQSFDIIVSKTLNGPALVTKYGVNVNDTSQTAVDSVTAQYNPVDEGVANTFTFHSDRTAGVRFYWAIDTFVGTNMNAGRFSVLQGSNTWDPQFGGDTGGAVIVSADAATSPDTQSYTFRIYDDEARTHEVGNVVVTVNDTSQTTVTYSRSFGTIGPSPQSSMIFGTGVFPFSVIGWTMTGPGITQTTTVTGQTDIGSQTAVDFTPAFTYAPGTYTFTPP